MQFGRWQSWFFFRYTLSKHFSILGSDRNHFQDEQFKLWYFHKNCFYILKIKRISFLDILVKVCLMYYPYLCLNFLSFFCHSNSLYFIILIIYNRYLKYGAAQLNTLWIPFVLPKYLVWPSKTYSFSSSIKRKISSRSGGILCERMVMGIMMIHTLMKSLECFLTYIFKVDSLKCD